MMFDIDMVMTLSCPYTMLLGMVSAFCSAKTSLPHQLYEVLLLYTCFGGKCIYTHSCDTLFTVSTLPCQDTTEFACTTDAQVTQDFEHGLVLFRALCMSLTVQAPPFKPSRIMLTDRGHLEVRQAYPI